MAKTLFGLRFAGKHLRYVECIRFNHRIFLFIAFVFHLLIFDGYKRFGRTTASWFDHAIHNYFLRVISQHSRSKIDSNFEFHKFNLTRKKGFYLYYFCQPSSCVYLMVLNYCESSFGYYSIK